MTKNLFCCVCKKSENDPTSKNTNFFRFPKTQHLKEKWLKNLNIAEKNITENSAVCSLHFLNSDININGDVVTLKRTAIPLNKTMIKIGSVDDDQEASGSKSNDTEETEPKISNVNKRIKHKMVPVDETDTGFQMVKAKTAKETECDFTPTVVANTRVTRSTMNKPSTNETSNEVNASGKSTKRKRDKPDESDETTNTGDSEEELEKAKKSEQEKEPFGFVLKASQDNQLTPREVEMSAIVENSLLQYRRKRQRAHDACLKTKVKLRELTNCLDTIGDKYNIANFSRKVLSAPKKSKLGQFFNQLSEVPTNEQINIEIVDDDLNVVNKTNIDVSPGGTLASTSNIIKIEARKKFLKGKLKHLAEVEAAKELKIKQLREILKQKSEAVSQLENEAANLRKKQLKTEDK